MDLSLEDINPNKYQGKIHVADGEELVIGERSFRSKISIHSFCRAQLYSSKLAYSQIKQLHKFCSNLPEKKTSLKTLSLKATKMSLKHWLRFIKQMKAGTSMREMN